MRILLIGNYALDNQESMLRCAALMERALKARGHIVRLVQPQAHLARSTSGPGKWLGYLDKIVLFPFHLKQALKDFATGLAPLGTPEEFVQVNQGLRGGMTLRSYRIRFANNNVLRAWTYEMPDGKLEQYQIAEN